MEQGNLSAAFAENALLGAQAREFFQTIRDNEFMSLFEYAQIGGRFIASETEAKLSFILHEMDKTNKPYVDLKYPGDITIEYLTREGFAVLAGKRLTLTDRMFDRLKEYSGVTKIKPPSSPQDRTVSLILV